LTDLGMAGIIIVLRNLSNNDELIDREKIEAFERRLIL
jgi:hypothetical protein